MAEGTYEFECMRAELLGIEAPDRQEFEKAQAKIKLEQEQAEAEAEAANLLDAQDETLTSTSGKMDELNTILSATQQKLNRFKQTACGSLTNIFGRGSVDLTDKEAPNTSDATGKVDINEALDNLEEIKETGAQSNVSAARNASLDIQKKMTSHLGKLDSLINKAENAQIAMDEQKKQMRGMLK